MFLSDFLDRHISDGVMLGPLEYLLWIQNHIDLHHESLDYYNLIISFCLYHSTSPIPTYHSNCNDIAQILTLKACEKHDLGSSIGQLFDTPF
jgi:hypothetical protein